MLPRPRKARIWGFCLGEAAHKVDLLRRPANSYKTPAKPQMYAHMHTHTHTHTRTHTHTHTHTHTRMHTCALPHAPTCPPTHKHTHIVILI